MTAEGLGYAYTEVDLSQGINIAEAMAKLVRDMNDREPLLQAKAKKKRARDLVR